MVNPVAAPFVRGTLAEVARKLLGIMACTAGLYGLVL